jgi:hypothetical protein
MAAAVEARGGAESPAPDEAVWAAAPALARPLYGVDERPGRWWEALRYGWQHTLVDISPFPLPLAVGGALALGGAAAREEG